MRTVSLCRLCFLAQSWKSVRSRQASCTVLVARERALQLTRSLFKLSKAFCLRTLRYLGDRMTSLLRREKARFLVEELSLQLQSGEESRMLSPSNSPLKISGSFQVSQQPSEPPSESLQKPNSATLPCYKGLPSQEAVRQLIEVAVINKVRPAIKLSCFQLLLQYCVYVLQGPT